MRMTSLMTDAGVLANVSEISRHSRNYGTTQQLLLILSALGIGIVVWVVLYALGRLSQRKPKETSTQKPLMDQLAEGLNLSQAEVHLLQRLASRNGLQPPEVLLIDPALWKPCMESCPHERGKLQDLMEKLFGTQRTQQFLEAN